MPHSAQHSLVAAVMGGLPTWTALIVTSLALGCSTPSGSAPDGGGGAGQVGAAGGGTSPGQAGANGVVGSSGDFAPPAAGLRRLSTSEYRNSIADILGVEPPGVEELPADDLLGGFVSIGARRVAISPSGVERFEELSYDIALAAFAPEGARSRLVPCQPATAEDSCAQEFVRAYARRFFRRPASAEEMVRLTKVVRTVAEASDVWTGLSYALAAMLQSPNFLYRVELGEAHTQPGWRRYDSYERATRLSFLLTGSTPDDALLSAAEARTLDTPEGLAVQLDRLMLSPRLQDTISTFFDEQLDLSAISDLTKDAALVSPSLLAAMHQEAELTVRDWIWTQQRPVSELVSSPQTFVNRELAEFYGLAPAAGADFELRTRSSDDPRVGLLGAAGILALNAGFTENSPTKRGRYVMERLLCTEIPDPPDDVDTILKPPPEGVVMTMRQRVAEHLKKPSCAACHQFVDPVGLPLEHFDAAGRYRETDQGLEIDASGALGDVTFDGLRGLATALASDARVDACMVQRFYGYALGHHITPTDQAAVLELDKLYGRGAGDFSRLVRALVQHNAFLFASEPAK